MAAAVLIWTAAQGLWTFFGLTLDHVYPFPSLADAGFVGYAVPAAVALFLFPRFRSSGVALLRTLLDASVIAAAVLYVSWATVLGPVYKVADRDFLGHLTGVAYPIVDVVLVSLVLVLTMRSAPEDRFRWLCLGGGLLVLAFTDSTYVKLSFDGVIGLTGTPLAAGWVTAFLLMAIAPFASSAGRRWRDRRAYTLGLELLPYVPVLGAALVSPGRLRTESDPFLLVTGLVVLALVIARQIVIILQNITLTRDLESKVADRTAQLEGLAAIVNSTADAIVGKTPDGVITSWNPGAERIYGYRADDAIGRHASSFLIPGYLLEQENAFLTAAGRGGETNTYESERMRGDGATVPVSVTMSPIRGDNGIHGVATIAQDITERRTTETELREARESAVESSRLKSEFLATMSHEIRTPMNGVVGLTALMLETELDQTQRHYAEGVKGAAEALLNLINDILDFSKLEAGKVDLELIEFDPRRLVEEVAGLLAEPAQSKGLELIAYCSPDVPVRLLGDAGRLRQILLNLANNAVKFTSVGEIAIRVSISGEADTRIVRFEVRDTGIGIDAADHSRLFESFSQADASTTRRYGGTGLGLAICRRLTEAMRGQIGLVSAPGQGSTFWFTVPLPAAAPDDDSALDAPAPLTGLRVLVVDDNATNRLVLESQLASWGMIPESVDSAERAATRLREETAAGRPYDIAVLDMCMPGTNGLELAHEISTDQELGSVRLVMLTSSMQVTSAELRAAGIGQWLTKPVRSSDFYDRLMRIMAPERAPSLRPGPPAPAQPVPATRGRILVVEDNEVNQLVARSMAARLGYAVDVVSDGAQAVTATAELNYAAVLMDCHMPVMDGFEATRAIRRRDGGFRHLPIIAMTAGALEEDRDKCMAAGMDAFLTKPVDMERLGELLAEWVPSVSSPASGPALDPERLEVLRGLGPSDGQGLLPDAAEVFRVGVQVSLISLRRALSDGDGDALEQAAHKLKGAAANIGAIRAAAMCGELERGAARNVESDATELLARLEDELELVDTALRAAVDGAL
ncbi:response regulator [Pseudarthrobacter sp. YS3]|uniref:hybrid sensor histidine kinase/response regulator n=1 Tax=Pseudarthrobacter sp. YS3 TaxID=3453718 RepID=UPI003EEEF9A6